MQIVYDSTVLYIEDDIITNEIVTGLLLKKFKNVISVQNGQEGIEAFNKSNPDLIITDLNMPVMCGCKLIKHIREMNTDVPIIITTAHPEHLFGDLFFITKPMLQDEFFTTIDAVMDKKSTINIKDELSFYEKRHPNGKLSPCWF